MIGSVFKEFPESYSQANENWEELASEEVTNVVSVAFKETISETALKNLMTKVALPEKCKFAQEKLVNPVFFCFCFSFNKEYRYKTTRSLVQYVKNDWLLY